MFGARALSRPLAPLIRSLSCCAFLAPTHVVSLQYVKHFHAQVLITKHKKEAEDCAWITNRGGVTMRPALVWKRKPDVFITARQASQQLGFRSETVMWLPTRQQARLVEECLQVPE